MLQHLRTKQERLGYLGEKTILEIVRREFPHAQFSDSKYDPHKDIYFDLDGEDYLIEVKTKAPFVTRGHGLTYGTNHLRKCTQAHELWFVNVACRNIDPDHIGRIYRIRNKVLAPSSVFYKTRDGREGYLISWEDPAVELFGWIEEQSIINEMANNSTGLWGLGN